MTIRRALDEGGELSAIVELRQHFPLITDNAASATLRPRHRELAAADTEQGFA